MVARQFGISKLWPPWAAIGLPLLLIALNATPVGINFDYVILVLPVLLGAWACSGLWALVLAVQHLRRHEWSRVLATAVLPSVILCASARPLQFLHFCNDAGDVVYFLAERSSYLERIRSIPTAIEPRLLVFNRGGMLWASRGYVYDESDEVVRDQPLQSAVWKTRADETELTCGYSAQPFPGHLSLTEHWYLASFAC